jgi:hypothetical protein
MGVMPQDRAQSAYARTDIDRRVQIASPDCDVSLLNFDFGKSCIMKSAMNAGTCREREALRGRGLINQVLR